MKRKKSLRFKWVSRHVSEVHHTLLSKRANQQASHLLVTRVFIDMCGTELPRYSDKYRPSVTSQPTLKRKDLFAPYFPPDIFEGYFNPKKKRKGNPPFPVVSRAQANPDHKVQTTSSSKKRMNLEEMADDAEEVEHQALSAISTR